MKKLLISLTAIATIFSLVACENLSPTEKGAAYGAGAGAILGGVIGKNVRSAGIGALGGGVAGALIGNLVGQNQPPRPVMPAQPSQYGYAPQPQSAYLSPAYLGYLPYGRMLTHRLVESPYHDGLVIDVVGIPRGAILVDRRVGRKFRMP
jgi:hypothetical protein